MEKKYPPVFVVTRKPSNFQTLLDERPRRTKKSAAQSVNAICFMN